MIELAEIIAADGRFAPLMLLTTPAMSALAPQAERMNIACLDVSAAVGAALERAGGDTNTPGNDGRTARTASARLPHALLGMWREIRLLNAWRSVLEGSLNDLQPAAVMVPGDRELEPVAPMLAICRKRAIPTIICTSNIPDIGALRLSRGDNEAFGCGQSAPLLNRVAALLFPRQVDASDDSPKLFSPGWRTFALASRGMMSNNPWVQGGGLASHVLHYSTSLLDVAIQQGLDANKAVLVGDHTLDPLYRAFVNRQSVRRELSDSLEINGERDLVIVAVPNDAEHGLCDFPTHLKRLDTWLQHLHEGKQNVVLSLHPKSQRSTYTPLAAKYGFHIADRKLSEILPAADLFVCSCSSTIDWALLCGIPVINMDYVPFRIPHFLAPAGVQTCETPKEFRYSLQHYHQGHAATGLAKYAEKLRSDCFFDGNAGHRICELLATMFESGNVTADNRTMACDENTAKPAIRVIAQ